MFNQEFSLRSNFDFVRNILPKAYGFTEEDVKTVQFQTDGELEVDFVSENEIGDGFVVPANIVRKRIFPVIGIAGLLLKDYTNDTFGVSQFSPMIESLIQESMKRNIRHFLFYIPENSIEAVDVLPMFDRDLVPLAEDHKDVQQNMETASPLPYIRRLLNPEKEDGNTDEIHEGFDNVTVTSVESSEDKFELAYTVDHEPNKSSELVYVDMRMKFGVSSVTPSQISGVLCMSKENLELVLPMNFAKGKYADKTFHDIYSFVTKFRAGIFDRDKEWNEAFQSMLDWDKCSGKTFDLLSQVLNYFDASGEAWTFSNVIRAVVATMNEIPKIPKSLRSGVGKCLGYMLAWQAFGCRTCEHLPE